MKVNITEAERKQLLIAIAMMVHDCAVTMKKAPKALDTIRAKLRALQSE